MKRLWDQASDAFSAGIKKCEQTRLLWENLWRCKQAPTNKESHSSSHDSRTHPVWQPAISLSRWKADKGERFAMETWECNVCRKQPDPRATSCFRCHASELADAAPALGEATEGRRVLCFWLIRCCPVGRPPGARAKNSQALLSGGGGGLCRANGPLV